MKYFIQICVTVIFLVAYSASSFAQSTEPERHVLLQQMIDEKNLNLYYLGKSYGMDGWVLEGGDIVQYAYTTTEGGIVFGLQFGPDGQIETNGQLKTLQGKMMEERKVSSGVAPSIKPKPTTAVVEKPKNKAVRPSVTQKSDKIKKTNKNEKSKSELFYAAAENSNWISIGDSNAPYIYIFMNLACEHCQDYWNDVSPAIENGSIQIRLIPFGKVDINREAGAALLSVEKPADAWKKYVAGDKDVLSSKLATKESYAKIDSNSQLWSDWQLPSAPFTVYYSTTAKKIKVIAGRPDNTLLLLSEIMN